MKLNNKGFAITTILYGTLVLFLLLFVSLLAILSQYRKNLEKLVESSNGAREIVTLKPDKTINIGQTVTKRGLYNIENTCYKYLSIDDVASCE